MKIEKKDKEFKPITIEITIESIHEVLSLFNLYNIDRKISEYVSTDLELLCLEDTQENKDKIKKIIRKLLCDMYITASDII